jgi:hypothetical protein
VELARELQKLRGLELEEERLATAASANDQDTKSGPRRFTIMDLEQVHQRRPNVGSLANAFEHRFISASLNMDCKLNILIVLLVLLYPVRPPDNHRKCKPIFCLNGTLMCIVV